MPYPFTTDQQPGAERRRELARLMALPCFTEAERARALEGWPARTFDGQCRAIHALILEATKRGTNPTSGPPPVQCRPDWWLKYLNQDAPKPTPQK